MTYTLLLNFIGLLVFTGCRSNISATLVNQNDCPTETGDECSENQKVINTSNDGNDSNDSNDSGPIMGTVASPTFAPAAGSYPAAQNVTISSATDDVTIYYTIDGDTPTTSSTKYSGVFSIGVSQTLKALAVKSDWVDSDVASAVYTIDYSTSTIVTPSAANQHVINVTVMGNDVVTYREGFDVTDSCLLATLGPVRTANFVLEVNASAANARYLCCVVKKASGVETIHVIDLLPYAAAPDAVSIATPPPAISFLTGMTSAVVGNGTSEYSYVLLTGALPCTGVTYGGWYTITTALNIADAGADNETKTLCINGRSAVGATQATPTVVTWEKRLGHYALITNLSKLTVADAIIKASPTTTDHNYRISEGLQGRALDSFVINGTVYFAGPCKDSGGGRWNACFSTWDGVSLSGAWVDGNSGLAGIQSSILATTLTTAGTIVGNHAWLNLTTDVSGSIFGFGVIDRNAVGTYRAYPIVANDLASFTSLSYVLAAQNPYTSATNDSTWTGATVGLAEVLVDNGTVYIYRTTSNAPTSTLRYISVVEATTDMSTFTMPADYILSNYERPHVARDGRSYHMVAYNRTTKIWQYIAGTSPTDWDVSHAQDLLLTSLVGKVGDWDERYFNASADNEVRLYGLEVVGGSLMLFYMAGDYDFAPPATPPLNGARGIGVFQIPLTR